MHDFVHIGTIGQPPCCVESIYATVRSQIIQSFHGLSAKI